MRLAASLPVPPNLPMCQRVARRVEELGYESVWIADTGAGPDAFVVATAVADVTQRLRIGTAVIPVYTRTPSVFAASAGSVAQLAPGRFVLGIGASSETIVAGWGGVPFEKPLTHMREAVTVIRQMLAGDRVTFEGKRLRSRGFRLVSPPPSPVPIYVAALMPSMLELAGELADGVVLNMMPVEAVPRMMEHVRRGAARAGRDPKAIEVVSRFQVLVTDDPAGARSAVRQMFGPYFATSVYNRFAAWCGFADEAREILAAWQAKDRGRNLAAVTDAMVDRIAIIGSAGECRRRLRAFHDAGVTTPMVHPFAFDERAIFSTLEGLAPGSQA
ncbi:MAG TPA: LLM class flavin-dependent oxidoreductase [Candidatus Eisenbacteria bacterium]|nr:LLM class flavin-dependent oxidoreductase [Candidatus Eisenbacteria bacterium]